MGSSRFPSTRRRLDTWLKNNFFASQKNYACPELENTVVVIQTSSIHREWVIMLYFLCRSCQCLKTERSYSIYFLRLGVCVFICVIVIWLGSSDILQVDTGSYSIFSCVFIGTVLVLQVVGLGL